MRGGGPSKTPRHEVRQGLSHYDFGPKRRDGSFPLKYRGSLPIPGSVLQSISDRAGRGKVRLCLTLVANHYTDDILLALILRGPEGE